MKKVWQSKIARVLIVLAIILGAAGVAFAAWSQTKSVQTTAVVLGTFTLENLQCEDAIHGEWGDCVATIQNTYGSPVVIDSATLLIAQAGAVAYGEVMGNGSTLPQTMAPGATVTLSTSWRPEVGQIAEGTVIDLTMEVTASGG